MERSGQPQTQNLTGSRWAPISLRQQTSQSSTTTTRRTSPQRRLPQHHQQQQTAPTPSIAALQQTVLPQTSSVSQSEANSKRRDHARFAKLLRRLRWKCMSLATGYQRALQLHQTQQESSYHSTEQIYDDGDGRVGASVWDIPAEEAETMFKIDFFEFYVLLERVIVHLLAVFGMKVKAAAPTQNVGDGGGNGGGGNKQANQGGENAAVSSIIGDSRTFYGYSHRFHENVLAALENSRCPLHQILGSGTVIEYLRMTKDFRNRWKDVDDRPSEDSEEEWLKRRLKRYEKVMKDLQLESMLDTILTALHTAGRLAEQELGRIEACLDPTLRHDALRINAEGAAEWHMSDVPWEAVPDQMDLDN